MGKLSNMKLKKSLFVYLIFFLSTGLILSLFTRKICTDMVNNIWLDNVKNMDEYTNFQKEYNEKFGDYLPIPSVSLEKLKMWDRVTIQICDFIETWSLFFFAFGGALIAVVVFYNKKLKMPLELLNWGTSEIGRSNLDFEFGYEPSDEMGELCAAFEKMRMQLVENNCCMWKMIEEQKQLRAAFTHDIRAPLAVLKGYIQLLLRYIPDNRIHKEKQMEILYDMVGQAERLEEFSDSIKKIQKLEHIKLKKIKMDFEIASAKIEKSVTLLAEQAERQVSVDYNSSGAGAIVVDINSVLEVAENIFTNGLRYAKEKIEMNVYIENHQYLKIEIMDDGSGFSKKDIVHGCKPYYHNEDEDYTMHYGMGLYICKTLCEKHGGNIELCNENSGGAKVGATFNIED